MKKALISIILLLSLLLCGCDSSASEPETYRFYFPRIQIAFNCDDGVITHESRKLPGMNEDYIAILNTYLLGPDSNELSSPFPTGSRITSISSDNNIITVTLSSEFSSLTGLEMTIACTCIVKTVFSLTNADSVILKAESSFSDGSIYKAYSRASILTNDSAKDLGIARQNGE